MQVDAEGERNALLPTLPRIIYLQTDTHTLEDAVIYASHVGTSILICNFMELGSIFSNDSFSSMLYITGKVCSYIPYNLSVITALLLDVTA